MRLAWVKREVPFEADSVRFIGGQLRLVGGRIGVEVAVDRHSEKFEALNQKVVEMPIQTSVLLRLANGKVAPFLLEGRAGIAGRSSPQRSGRFSVNTTEFGWHAGVGLEVHPGRTLRHPRRLPLHVPRFQQRQRRGNRRRDHRRAAPWPQGIDVDARRDRLLLIEFLLTRTILVFLVDAWRIRFAS